MTTTELLAIARAATPGEWTAFEETVWQPHDDGWLHIADVENPDGHAGETEAANAHHIATFSPARVIALLEFVQAWDAWREHDRTKPTYDELVQWVERGIELEQRLEAKRRALDES